MQLIKQEQQNTGKGQKWWLIPSLHSALIRGEFQQPNFAQSGLLALSQIIINNLYTAIKSAHLNTGAHLATLVSMIDDRNEQLLSVLTTSICVSHELKANKKKLNGWEKRR